VPVAAIVLCCLLGLYMAWNIGANDVANSMADAVGSGAISIKGAIIAAGVCEFAGAVLVGSHVTDTVRKGIVNPDSLAATPEVLALGMACALLAAALWLHGATLFGMPVSTTHSIVGAVAGFGVVAAGWGCVNWGKMGQIVASWFVSPIAGAFCAYWLFRFMNRFILGQKKPVKSAITITPYIVFIMSITVTLATIFKGLKHIIKDVDWLTDGVALAIAVGVSVLAAVVSRVLVRRVLADKTGLELTDQLQAVEKVYAPLVVITSCSVAFAHGANDVANAVGPLAAVIDIVKEGTVRMKVHVPLWVLALGGVGIVAGLATCGYRVMETVGKKITQLTPTRGVAADIAATATVLACTRLKLPVSTTHTLVGAILGVGLARGLSAVNSRVARSIFGSWLITVPIAAALCIILFLAGQAVLL